MNTNIVVIAGNLTKDVELKFTQSGTPIANMAIANNQKRKVGDEWEDEVSFYDVVVWSNQGERCAKNLTKGSPVLIEGKLKQERFKRKDGSKGSKVKIIASKVSWDKPKQQQPEDMSQHNQTIEDSDDTVPF